MEKTCSITSNGINVTANIRLERIDDPRTLTRFIYRISFRIENSSSHEIILKQRCLVLKQNHRPARSYNSNGINGQYPKIHPNRFLSIDVPIATQATPVVLQHFFHFQTPDGQTLHLKTPEQTLAPYVFN
jgi:uncharacterized protein affecting Mg2+/Co2+ transport